MTRSTIRISPRRAALCGLLMLILGVVTTVGVAWGLALVPARFGEPKSGVARFSADAPAPTPGFAREVQVYTLETRGATRVVTIGLLFMYPDDWWGREPQVPATAVLPPWSRVELSADLGDSIIVEDARGWPLVSLSAEHVVETAADGQTRYVSSVRGGIPIRLGDSAPVTAGLIDIRPRFYSSQAVPLRPILPGFIINTLFYAAIWFVLFFGFGFVKRTIRRKRGRCVRCGYDLRYHHAPCSAGGQPTHAERGATSSGNGCPECGWNRREADA